MILFYTLLTGILIAIGGYLIGSIPSALLLGRIKGVDIRDYGSHNAGGTNLGRTVSGRLGILAMVLDMIKCYLPCLLVFLIMTLNAPISFLVPLPQLTEIYISVVAFAVAIGHCYPLYAHFRGGKVVSCFAGYMLFLSPLIAAVGCLVFFSVLKLFRKVSLASVIGVPSCFLVSFIPMALDLTILPAPAFNGGTYFGAALSLHLTYVTTIAIFLMTILVLSRHAANIQRLMKGKEPDTHFKKN
jgi:acyl phosphate:glycerol-3-phosphate acyltransferase